MPNTHRAWAQVPIWAGSTIKFDQIASMIAAGSAVGGAFEGGASVAFPRAASLQQANGSILYQLDTLLFRSTASINWTTDPIGTANASVGIPMFPSDPRSVVYPSNPKNFAAYGISAGAISMIFVQGDDLEL